MGRTVRVVSGQKGVILPNGRSYDGQVDVTLTDAEFAQLDPDLFPAILADEGAVPQMVGDTSGPLTVDAPVGSPVFVRLSDGAAPITTLPVSGPATDTQLRATPLPISGTVTANPATGALTDRSGSIQTGDVAQNVMASNANRKYLLLQNPSDTAMWYNFTTTAIKDSPSILLPAGGGGLIMDGDFISTEAISIICATAGKKYTAKEG